MQVHQEMQVQMAIPTMDRLEVQGLVDRQEILDQMGLVVVLLAIIYTTVRQSL